MHPVTAKRGKPALHTAYPPAKLPARLSASKSQHGIDINSLRGCVACNQLPVQAQELMYGQTTSGMFGYSHLTGAYQGGQADYVRVPLGEQHLGR